MKYNKSNYYTIAQFDLGKRLIVHIIIYNIIYYCIMKYESYRTQ